MTGQRQEPVTKGDLDQLRQELVAKIDANGAKIDANAVKIDANSVKIDAIAKKLDANSATLSSVSHKVVENSEQIGRLVVMAEEARESLNQVLGTLDGLASGFAKLDQERVAMNARLDRVEKDVDTNKADIKKIKTKLAMP